MKSRKQLPSGIRPSTVFWAMNVRDGFTFPPPRDAPFSEQARAILFVERVRAQVNDGSGWRRS
jgi:hypothetical protein